MRLLEPPEALLELRLMALSEIGMKASSLVRDGSSVCVIVTHVCYNIPNIQRIPLVTVSARVVDVDADL